MALARQISSLRVLSAADASSAPMLMLYPWFPFGFGCWLLSLSSFLEGKMVWSSWGGAADR